MHRLLQAVAEAWEWSRNYGADAPPEAVEFALYSVLALAPGGSLPEGAYRRYLFAISGITLPPLPPMAADGNGGPES
jgi:hypothetical protein